MGYKITEALRDVIAEREKQISKFGFDDNHDDIDDPFNKSNVGALYAMAASSTLDHGIFEKAWPTFWVLDFWRPEASQRDNLVKAAALILAEIEGLDRANEAEAVKQDFLKRLREANVSRGQIWKYTGTDEDTFLSNELAGEVGEVAGAAKKLHRYKYGIVGNKETFDELATNLREEIGDVMICLDRLANYYGVDIEEVTRDKFDSKSKEVGIDIFVKD